MFERDASWADHSQALPLPAVRRGEQGHRARPDGEDSPTERGGVVWHTQGRASRLTMLWLALKLRRDPAHENPTLVIVTDRKDLDEQISEDVPRLRLPEPRARRERPRPARPPLRPDRARRS